jgi:hypothetical protein
VFRQLYQSQNWSLYDQPFGGRTKIGGKLIFHNKFNPPLFRLMYLTIVVTDSWTIVACLVVAALGHFKGCLTDPSGVFV